MIQIISSVQLALTVPIAMKSPLVINGHSALQYKTNVEQITGKTSLLKTMLDISTPSLKPWHPRCLSKKCNFSRD